MKAVCGVLRLPPAMKAKLKDRVLDVLLILLFLTIIAGSAYLIFKIMTRWTVKGLG